MANHTLNWDNLGGDNVTMVSHLADDGVGCDGGDDYDEDRGQ